MKLLIHVPLLTCAIATTAATAAAAPPSTPAQPASAAPSPVICPSAAALLVPEVRESFMPWRGEVPRGAWRIEVRPWKVEPPVCVVLVATTERALARLGQVFLLSPGADTGSIVSRMVGSSGLISLAPDERAESLDLAPYTIRDGDRALGVRVTRRRAVGAGRASASVLRLFQKRGSHFQEILSTVMSLEARVTRQDGGAALEEMRQDRAVLMVSSQTTNGYRDLVKTTDPARKLVYRWKDGRYELDYVDFMEGLGLDVLGVTEPRDQTAEPWTRTPVSRGPKKVAMDRGDGDHVYVSPDGKRRLVLTSTPGDEGADFPTSSAYLVTDAGSTLLGDFRSIDYVRWSADSQTVIFEGRDLVEYGISDVVEFRYRSGDRSMRRRRLAQTTDEPSG